jgi:hypothetical protein
MLMLQNPFNDTTVLVRCVKLKNCYIYLGLFRQKPQNIGHDWMNVLMTNNKM